MQQNLQQNLGETAEQPQAPVATPKRDAWKQAMAGKYPELADDEEALYEASMKGYDQEHDFAKKTREENAELADILASNQGLSNMYTEMFKRGKEGHPEEALRMLPEPLKKYITGEIESEEYRSQSEADAKSAADKQAKMDAQDKAYEEWCKKKGYDPEEWAGKVAEALIQPFAQYELAEAQFDLIDKMLNHDADVEAARVEGRNANIVANRKKMQPKGDGMPSGASASSGYKAPEKSNSLDSVVQARMRKRNL